MLILSSFCALLVLSNGTQVVDLKKQRIIHASCKVSPGTYNIENENGRGTDGAIKIQGDNIEVDFTGVVLRGSPQTAEPNDRKGTAVYVSGKNIKIRGLRAHGYKLGIVARNSPGIQIIDCDLSYNWKQKLLSTLDREDGADWMSFHRNERDEWLRFGCGIYLRKCDNFNVQNCTIVGGQSGLYLMESNNGRVWNNNFSFLSAVGLAMYLSSNNKIMHNNIDWCVRGYSHGKWNRGQDSAGIIIYEQCNNNTFAYNSVTHGGDGFFLWAGQSTMDTGKGGCNDNLLYGNDWSHAPTNGIEATFSRNKFVNNLIMECWHGIWGGFGWNSLVLGNVFAYNADGIAWEHGQENQVLNNIFYRDTLALNIWQNPTIDPNWGYGKARDCASRDWLASANLFSNCSSAVMNVRATKNFQFSENKVMDCGKLLLPADADRKDFSFANNLIEGADVAGTQGLTWGTSVASPRPAKPLPPTMLPSGNVIQEYSDNYSSRFRTNWDPFRKTIVPISIGTEPQGKNLVAEPQRGAKAPNASSALDYAPPPIAGGKNPFLNKGQLRGRRYILVDEWGPYDFKSPIIWPRGEIVNNSRVCEILGPKGSAKVTKSVGCKINAISTDGGKSWLSGAGAVGASVTVPSLVRVAFEGGAIEQELEFEYVGGEVVDYRGVVTPKGKPFKFGFREFNAPIDWDVKWFVWDKNTSDPRTQMEAFETVINGTPVKTAKLGEINFAGDVPGVQGNYYATVANGTFELPAGKYIVEITTDDGARLWFDDKLIIDEWHYQGPTAYSKEIEVTKGKHTLRVWHFEIDGYSALKVTIKPVARRQ